MPRRAHHWIPAGVALPRENPAHLRALAVSAAWTNGLLEHPPQPAPESTRERRCPVLPPFVPLVPRDGLVVAMQAGRFHGVPWGAKKEEAEVSETAKCPYR